MCAHRVCTVPLHAANSLVCTSLFMEISLALSCKALNAMPEGCGGCLASAFAILRFGTNLSCILPLCRACFMKQHVVPAKVAGSAE